MPADTTARGKPVSSRYGTPPIASFTANVTFGPKPLAVNFTDLSTNTPTSWNWTFGDGNFSVLQNPVHIYNLMEPSRSA